MNAAAPPFLLADDLSGALEAGAAWDAAGWRVELSLTPERAEAVQTTRVGTLRLVSTETRNATAAAADKILREVLPAQRRAGRRLVGKKIDSTLRGPVGAELRTLKEIWQPPMIVVAPAHPRAGRVVRRGQLLVEGVPVAETAFAQDPHVPVTDSHVRTWLGVDAWARCGQLVVEELRSREHAVRALERLRADAIEVVLADAETEEQLRVLAHALPEAVPGAVLAGSGAALAGLVKPALHPADPPVAAKDGGMLFVVGSRHPIGEAQVRALLATNEVAAWLGEGAPPRAAVCHLSGVPGIDAAGVRDRAAELAGRWMQAHAGGVIFVTGGETARVVAEALGADQLVGARPVANGVTRSWMGRGGGLMGQLWVKPGGFGDAQTLVRCWQHAFERISK